MISVAGEYELINEHGDKFQVYASENKAKFLFNAYSKLGFKSIKLIKEVHKSDFPKWSNII